MSTKQSPEREPSGGAPEGLQQAEAREEITVADILAVQIYESGHQDFLVDAPSTSELDCAPILDL